MKRFWIVQKLQVQEIIVLTHAYPCVKIFALKLWDIFCGKCLIDFYSLGSFFSSLQNLKYWQWTCNNWMHKIQNCLHVLQHNHRFRSLLSFWAATPLQSFPLTPLFVRHTHAQNPTLQPQNPWLSHFLTLWPPHLEQSPPRHQALCYSLFL